MNDVNLLRILQDVIDHRLTTRLAANRLEISDSTADSYWSAIMNMDHFHLLTIVMTSLVTWAIWSVTVSVWHSTATRLASRGSTTGWPLAEMAWLSSAAP